MRLTSLLFPVPCVGCGAPGTALCATCLASLGPAGDGPLPAGLDSCQALTSYEGTARRVITGIKYRNDRSALSDLAGAAAYLVDGLAVDVVTWVPTVPSHRRGRGFDQGELLARAIARSAARPARRLLDRTEGPGQTGRDRVARSDPTPFVGRRGIPVAVLLVDDVVTTGATMSAAAGELRRGGAAHVHGLALGRTVRP